MYPSVAHGRLAGDAMGPEPVHRLRGCQPSRQREMVQFLCGNAIGFADMQAQRVLGRRHLGEGGFLSRFRIPIDGITTRDERFPRQVMPHCRLSHRGDQRPRPVLKIIHSGENAATAKLFMRRIEKPPVVQRRSSRGISQHLPPRRERLDGGVDLDDQMRRYFGTADMATVPPAAMEAGLERMRVDLGLERDRSRRFALWTLMYMLDAAPDLDVVFKDAADLAAARTLMEMSERFAS